MYIQLCEVCMCECWRCQGFCFSPTCQLACNCLYALPFADITSNIIILQFVNDFWLLVAKHIWKFIKTHSWFPSLVVENWILPHTSICCSIPFSHLILIQQASYILLPLTSPFHSLSFSFLVNTSSLSDFPLFQQVAVPSNSGVMGMMRPVTGTDVGIRRAEIRQGMREIILCKDQEGKVGLRLRAIDNVSVRHTFYSYMFYTPFNSDDWGKPHPLYNTLKYLGNFFLLVWVHVSVIKNYSAALKTR